MLCNTLDLGHLVATAVSITGQDVVQPEIEEPEQVGRRGRLAVADAAAGARAASRRLRRLDVLLVAHQFVGRGRRRAGRLLGAGHVRRCRCWTRLCVADGSCCCCCCCDAGGISGQTHPFPTPPTGRLQHSASGYVTLRCRGSPTLAKPTGGCLKRVVDAFFKIGLVLATREE